MDEAAIRTKGLDFFRRTVALLYREIGVLKPANHAGVAAKAKLSEPFFADRKAQAKQLYKLSISDPTVELTLARYEERTGLTLEDSRQAFEEGKWGNPPSFGGRKWAAIASAAIKLGDAIREKAWPQVYQLTQEIHGLEHNNGRIVAKFSQLN